MQRRNKKHHSHQRPSLHPKAVSTSTDIYRHLKKASKYNKKSQEYVPPGVQLKSGTFTNFIILSIALNTYAVAAQMVTKADIDKVNTLANKAAVNCNAAVAQSFVETAKLNPSTMLRVLSILSFPGFNIICHEPKLNQRRIWSIEEGGSQQLQMANSGAPVFEVSKELVKVRHRQLHSSYRCNSKSYKWNALMSPVFPATEEHIKTLYTGLDKGDARIREFKILLNQFKTILLANGIIKPREPVDIIQFLPQRKLIIQNRKPNVDLNPMSNEDLNKLEKYLVATVGCLRNTHHSDMTETDYHKMMETNHIQNDVYFDEKTNCFLREHITKWVNDQKRVEVIGEYLYAYDSVANLADDLEHERAHDSYNSVFHRLSERHAASVHSLTDEALHVFYPEVEDIQKRDFARCDDKDEYRYRVEL